MKASRLLSILMLLQSRGRTSATALAQTLEVSPRTILRDIDQLSAAGVPVWGEAGRQGGFQLRAGWSTSLTGLTEPESKAMLLAGLPTAASDLGLAASAASARLKMLAALPAEWRTQAEQVATRLHVDPLDWYRSNEQPAFLHQAAEAVWTTRRVAIRYASWRGSSERELEPLGLVVKAGTWYLAARSRGAAAIRTYRLASVQSLHMLPGHFRRPRSFDLAAYWRASSADFEAQLHPLQAQLALSPRAMDWLLNTRTSFDRAPADPAWTIQPGWTCIHLPIESIAHGTRRVLAFGTEAEVLGPPVLRRAVTQAVSALQARYAS